MTKQNRPLRQLSQLDNHALRAVTGGLATSVQKKLDDTTAGQQAKIG